MRKFQDWFRLNVGLSATPSQSLTTKNKKLLELATSCFGSAEKALDWLNTPHAALGDKSPFDLAKDEDAGYQEVVDEIVRIEHGIFA
jgi:putative toxin-antitoxin system antitoxin component (TIGR02293 family)